jgi:hypothetical protein
LRNYQHHYHHHHQIYIRGFILRFSCPKKEEATRDRRKLNTEEFDDFAKYSGDQTKQLGRDGASVM